MHYSEMSRKDHNRIEETLTSFVVLEKELQELRDNIPSMGEKLLETAKEESERAKHGSIEEAERASKSIVNKAQKKSEEDSVKLIANGSKQNNKMRTRLEAKVHEAIDTIVDSVVEGS